MNMKTFSPKHTHLTLKIHDYLLLSRVFRHDTITWKFYVQISSCHFTILFFLVLLGVERSFSFIFESSRVWWKIDLLILIEFKAIEGWKRQQIAFIVLQGIENLLWWSDRYISEIQANLEVKIHVERSLQAEYSTIITLLASHSCSRFYFFQVVMVVMMMMEN